MKVYSNATTKKLRDCQPGELIVFSIDAARTWGIVLADEKRKGMLVGQLKPLNQQVRRPTLLSVEKPTACVSYGTNWAARPIAGDESFAGYESASSLAGFLVCDEDHWLVCFDPEPGTSGEELYFDLKTERISGHLSQHAAPFRHWEVWERPEDIGRVGEPLFQMGAESNYTLDSVEG